MSRFALSLAFLSLVLGSCSGGGGGGSGGNPAAALGALGLDEMDLGQATSLAAVTSLRWATDDTLISTLASGCPSATAGPDNNTSGVPDTISIDFDCTVTDENLTLLGSIYLGEISDPSTFFNYVPPEYLAGAGVTTDDEMSWGMSGYGMLNVTTPQGSCVVTLGVQMAEFPALNKVVFFVSTSIGDLPLVSGTQIILNSNAIFTLPSDDSSDVPTGYVDTYLWQLGDSLPFAVYECQMLSDGRFHFELFNSDDALVARGLIDLAQGDENEIIFQ